MWNLNTTNFSETNFTNGYRFIMLTIVNSATFLVAHMYSSGEMFGWPWTYWHICETTKIQQEKSIGVEPLYRWDQFCYQKWGWHDQGKTHSRPSMFHGWYGKWHHFVSRAISSNWGAKKQGYYATITYSLYCNCITGLIFKENDRMIPLDDNAQQTLTRCDAFSIIIRGPCAY